MTSFFTISLDLELYWGVLSRLTIEEYSENLSGTHKAIRKTLDLFSEYDIHATWATVGFLFCDSFNEIKKYIPEEQPSYKNKKYNSYKELDTVCDSEKQSPYHLSPSIIEEISKTPFQEIATHTFSHYFCLEDGQSVEEFKQDIQAAIAVAEEKGYVLKSIIFPRNQFNKEYLNICVENGITVVRGNPKSNIYKPRKRNEESLILRGVRLLDTYINITGYQTAEITSYDGMIDVPASRFLRPYSKKMTFLDSLKLQRIKNEMTHSAKTGKVYHLWWHPHNFGKDVEENIQFLRKILDHFVVLKNQYNWTSMNMSEIAKIYGESKK